MIISPTLEKFFRGPEVTGKQFLFIGNQHNNLFGEELVLSGALHDIMRQIRKPFLFVEQKTRLLKPFLKVQRRRAPFNWASLLSVKVRLGNVIYLVPRKRIIPAWIEALKNARKRGITIIPSDIRRSVSSSSYLLNNAKFREFIGPVWEKYIADLSVHAAFLENKEDLTTRLGAVIYINEMPNYCCWDKETGKQISIFAGKTGGVIHFGPDHINEDFIKELGGEKNVALLSICRNRDQAYRALCTDAMQKKSLPHIYLQDEDIILSPAEYPAEWKLAVKENQALHDIWERIRPPRPRPPLVKRRRIKRRTFEAA